MDFGALPPEINSGLMYAGPGSGSMVAAATAWDDLASQLNSATGIYSSVISELTSGWRGPASTSMAGAAAPYVAWMSTTAAQTEQAATQARAAANAYEAAFAMTVPPSVIAANRSLLTSLVATNFLGQNTAAIAAAEAQYGEMWAQDAAAMYGYAADSAAASAVNPFTPPPQTTNPAGQAVQAATSAQTTGASAASNIQTELSQLLSAVPTALQGLTSPTSPTSAMMNSIGLGGADLSTPEGILNFLAGTDGSPMGAFLNDNFLNTIFSSGFYMPGNFLGTMTDFAGMEGGGAAAAAAADAGAGAAESAGSVGAGLASAVSPLGSTGLGGAVSGSLSQASSVGALSVPYGWTTAAPEIRLAAEALPGGGFSVAPALAAGGEGSMLSDLALASMAGRAMSGTSMGGRSMGVTAAQNRPLPIVIVKPPPSGVDKID
ncbi:PPE family protein [Mycobacterium heidelbergense]|uniref:Uncharacterized protein n=1 Tax=Mycobacterium heidelbergense TaxID=53376 RepID=A0A1X0DLJ7_MYCHE|nr:PPE family protein [Mycobacterium heidelbergense]MCV7051265.1 PPE family protein [Mycobacterium heidelbergense]ORA73258.1 hypothetical protein BST25_13085 [Mycobacterium heidelbergense]BBZ52002.1 PPE family protein [Mycobacterium heidelbergense]